MSQLKDEMVPYITETEILDMVNRLAKEIEADYQGREVILICALKGSIPFLADLMKCLRLPQKVDFVNLQAASRGLGVVKINKDISINISGKHVIIVEEIIDTGKTLSFLKNRLLASAPASLKIVTLLDKPARRVIDIKPDYVGRVIEDRYVIGYGLDDREIGRNYSDIYYLKH